MTGMMLKLSDNSNLTSKYVKSPQETKDIYTFSYYGLKNNNVLKRQLFHFYNAGKHTMIFTCRLSA